MAGWLNAYRFTPAQRTWQFFDFGQVDLGTLSLDATESGIKEGSAPYWAIHAARLLPDIILRYTLNVSQMSLKCYSFATMTETMHIDPHLLKRMVMPSPLSSLQGEERLAHSSHLPTSRQAGCFLAWKRLASRSAPRNAFSDACTAALDASYGPGNCNRDL